MAQVVTVMNMKGGVGKTTVCMHLAGIVGRYRIPSNSKSHKILCIDYDPQFNLSQALLRSQRYFQLEREARTCLRVLQDADADLDPFKIQTPSSATPPPIAELTQRIYQGRQGASCVDLIPSTLDLMFIAVGTAGGDISLIEARFKKFIHACRLEYDLILIDCHPAGSVLTRTSLQNSDHVLIPVAPQVYATRGIALMKRFLEASKPGSSGPTPHILFNLTPRSGEKLRAEQEIRDHKDYGPLCLTQTLKKYKAFSEPEDGHGFVWSSGKPYSTEAFRNLYAVAREFAERIAL